MTVFRLPVRLIEARFGAGNFDDAGDAVAAWLRDWSGGEDRYRIGYEFDSGHDNPWFHALALSIEGLPAPLCERLRRRLAQEGLADAAG